MTIEDIFVLCLSDRYRSQIVRHPAQAWGEEDIVPHYYPHGVQRLPGSLLHQEGEVHHQHHQGGGVHHLQGRLLHQKEGVHYLQVIN